jgi:hypothetical protein
LFWKGKAIPLQALTGPEGSRRPIVLYGYETWSMTLREELRLRVFENRVMRKIFGTKRDEVTGVWR